MKRITKLVAAAFGAVAMFVGSARAADITLTRDEDWGDGRELSGTIDLAGHKLTVSSLTGDATITDSTALGENIIQDGSFEAATIPASVNWGTWAYFSGGATSSCWQAPVDNRVGITKNETTWTSWVIGAQAAFIQGDSSKNVALQQEVQVPEDGEYLLAYSYVWRPGTGMKSQRLEVHVDDGPVCGATDSGASVAVNRVVLHLTAGPHTVKFVATTRDAYSTTILDDVSLRKIPAAGELHVVVPKNQTVEVTSVNLDGALTLVKEGAGTYLVSYKNGDGIRTSYVGGTIVREGDFKVHAANGNDYNFYQVQQLGAQGSELTVEEGATFDHGGNADGYCYGVVLNGGMLVFAQTSNATPLRFRLTADSFVNDMTSNLLLGETDLAGYTLDVTTNPNMTFAPNGAIRNGTLVSRGGRLNLTAAADLSTVDLVLDGTMSCAGGTFRVHDLKVTSTASGFGHGGNYYAVSGTYTPVSDQIHRFKLLDGSTIDLSGRTTALVSPASNGLFFEENATVYVDLGERKIDSSELLIAWSAKPEKVSFNTLPGVDGTFQILDEGLAFVSDEENVPTVVHWTGNGDVSNLDDPDNWACTNKFGRVVEKAIPTEHSTVYLPREVSLNPAGSSFTCKELVLAENSVLLNDADFTGLNVPINTTLDLCGHKFSVDGLVGTGTISDSTALGENIIQDGSFEAATIPVNNGTWGLVSSGAASPYWQATVPGRVGYAKSGTPWTSWVVGTKAAFFQSDGSKDVTLQQEVQVPEDGTYLLTYSYLWRQGTATPQHLEVHVDDGPVCGATDSGASVEVNKVVLHLSAGSHTIKFVATTHDATNYATTILDDVSLRKIPAAGELHVVVPNGQTVEVTSVNLDGALRLVKEGAGTYLVSYKNGDGIKTSYVGGTRVMEGDFKVHAANGNDYNFYQVQQLGAQGSELTVEEGATFDHGGNADGYCYGVVLNGGTLVFAQTSNATPLRFRLTADSFVNDMTSNLLLGETDLAGYTLDVTTNPSKTFTPNGAIRNGTLVSRGGRLNPTAAADLSTVDLVLDGTMSCAGGTFRVHDLKVTSTASGFGHGDNYYAVSGTYTPVSDQIHRFKLLDGSTIDLSGRTTALASPASNGLFFEENATVYVDLGERKVRSSEPLITWSAKPENVKFCLTQGATGWLEAKDDGLYRYTGFGIIVR